MNGPAGTDPPRPGRIPIVVVEGLAVRRRRSERPRAVVVLVHGAMDRAASFARVMRRLDGLDTIAYDRRGYAGSLGAGGTTPASSTGTGGLSRHVDDLHAVLGWAARDTPGLPLIVVGHSLGGLIALLAADPGGDSEAGCRGHTTVARTDIDAVCVFESPLPWTDPGLTTSGSRAIEVGRAHGAGAAAESFYRSVVGDAPWERLGRSDRALRVAEGPALLDELVDARRPRTTIPLPAPGCELNVGVSERGPAHLRGASEAIADAGGVDLHTIAGAGHGAHLSHPGEFSDWIRAAAPLPGGGRGIPVP